MGARREITLALVDRYRSVGRADKGRILDELCAVTGWRSQARGSGACQLCRDFAGGPAAAKADLWRPYQGCAGGSVGGFGSDLRQAAQGNDSHVAAFAGAAWPAQARPGRSSAGARRRRSHD